MTSKKLRHLALCSTAIVALSFSMSAQANPVGTGYAYVPPSPYVSSQQYQAPQPSDLRGPVSSHPVYFHPAEAYNYYEPSAQLPVQAPFQVPMVAPMMQPVQMQAPQILRRAIGPRPIQGFYTPPAPANYAPAPHAVAAPSGSHWHEKELHTYADKDNWGADNTSGDIGRPLTPGPGFKISVDGHTVAGGGFDYEAHQEATDTALYVSDVQVKFDGFDITPRLDIGLMHSDASIYRGQYAEFFTYSNYWNFIHAGEVRIFLPGQSIEDRPHMILPVESGVARFIPGNHLPNELTYQLRVYDQFGRFDETHPKTIHVTKAPRADFQTHHDPAATLAVYGNDNTMRRNIAIKGANVTVSGENVPPGYVPRVFHESVPVGLDGNFVTQQILPFGDRTVPVQIMNEYQQGIQLSRDIHIKGTDFFYVALGDITLGQRGAVGPSNLLAANDDDFEDVVVNGRGAFYLKGKVRGDYIMTAAMDTGEDRILDLFNNLDEKDPRQLLRRLDADRYYPVYGDHSTLREDAPTQGKFYVRVEKDDNHIMWGNFVTDIQDTEFTTHERGLYGGILDLNSEATTSFGERRSELTAYASDPGTIPEREIFRGTGGSLYFLAHQDVTIGSERLEIEIVDKVSGIVLERRALRPYEDYDFDYIQGRILLNEALQSTQGDGQLVRDGALSGNEVHLVVHYEHTPGFTNVSGFTVGGRATQWLGDVLRVGVSGKKDTTDFADQEVYGGDVLLRAGKNSFVKAEYAESTGLGFGQTESTDGGFIFDEYQDVGASDMIAKAYRLESQVDLADMTSSFNAIQGKLRGLIEVTDDGFAGTGRTGRGDVERRSASAALRIADRVNLNAAYDEIESTVRGTRKSIYADAELELTDRIAVGVGVRRDDQDNQRLLARTTSPNPLIQGQRTDASAQIRVEPMADVKLHAFGQKTLDRDGNRASNDRYGIGGDIQVSSRIKLTGEVSDGDGGIGANARVSFKKSDHSEVYLGYGIDPDHPEKTFNGSGIDLRTHGVLTAGGRTELTDSLSVYGEERIGMGQDVRSLTHAYGVKFKPDDKWALSASIEKGEIEDELNGNFDRTAFSVSASRASDKLRIASTVEARFEDGVLQGQARDRKTWLMRNSIAYDAHQDVQLLGRLNVAKSESDQSQFLDAEYIEGVAGIAYRPVEHDWMNTLLKYTYYEDLVPAAQRSTFDTQNLARQRTQILSADTIIDLTDRLSVGAKYGYREGEVALDRGSDNFVSSDAHLGVLRADYHVINNWDIMVEGRMMRTDLTEQTQTGALVGIYRHVGDNLKVGGGYSFSGFSDDLTDFDSDSKGLFINIVGKM